MVNLFDPMKILYHKDKIEQILKDEMPDPVFVTIDPSNRCQHNCFFCFVNDYRKSDWVDLKPDIFHQIIDDLAKRDVKAIAYCGGGEPLMNKETPNAMKHIHDVGIEQGLITNGGLLTNKICDTILDTCKFIRISIDAFDEKTHNKIHRANDFNNIISQIRYMVENKKKKTPEINVSYMLCPDNFDSIIPATKFYKSLGINSLIFKYIYTTYKTVKADYDSDKFIKKNFNLMKNLMDKSEKYSDNNFKIQYRHPWTFTGNKIPHLSNLYKKCKAQPLAMAGVAANGDLYLCCDRRGEMIVGNIPKDGRFWDLWGSKKHKEMFKNINLKECPQRCKATEHNIIIEKGFIENQFDWNMI